MPDIHNIFLDHLYEPAGVHHHHGPGDNDIVWHKHDGTDNHKHATDYDHILYGAARHDHPAAHYDVGPADHSHDEPADEYKFDDNGRVQPALVDSTVVNPSYNDHDDPTGYLHDDISWADNIDNITGGDPYHHTS